MSRVGTREIPEQCLLEESNTMSRRRAGVIATAMIAPRRRSASLLLLATRRFERGPYPGVHSYHLPGVEGVSGNSSHKMGRHLPSSSCYIYISESHLDGLPFAMGIPHDGARYDMIMSVYESEPVCSDFSFLCFCFGNVRWGFRWGWTRMHSMMVCAKSSGSLQYTIS